MPRTAPASQSGYYYHALNRGNARRTVYHKDGDYAAFLKLLCEAGERTDMRLLADRLMPNHFHLALWPRQDGNLSDYMMWLVTAHRPSLRRSRPYGDEGWMQETARRLGLEPSLRPRGRPRQRPTDAASLYEDPSDEESYVSTLANAPPISGN